MRLPRPIRASLTHAALVMIAGSLAHAGEATVSLQNIALTGEQALGADPGVTYASFSLDPRLRLSESGDFFFAASLTGPGISFQNNSVILSTYGGSLGVVARAETPAPSPLADLTQQAVLLLGSSSSGAAVYRSNLDIDDPGVGFGNNQAYWTVDEGGFSLLFREGSPAPGFSPDTIYDTSLRTSNINTSGELLHAARIQGPDVDFLDNQVLWFNDGGNAQVVMQTGQSAPGAGPGSTFAFEQSGSAAPLDFQIDDAGRATFKASYFGPGGEEDNPRVGIWTQRAGQIVPVAFEVRAEGPPAGTEPGVPLFNSIGGVTVAPDGRITFLGENWISGPGSSFARGLFTGQPGAIEQIAAAGTPAPGTGAGIEFLLFGNVGVNDSGFFAYDATLVGPGLNAENSHGIWVGTSLADTRLLVRGGDPAPGTTSDRFRIPRNTLVNNDGRMIFNATLAGPGVNPSNDHGVWAVDAEGEITLVLRAGDPYDFNGARTIQTVQHAFELTESGNALISVFFTDGTQGLIVATLPGSLCPGDCDDSGTVDFNDLVAMLFAFGPSDDEACDPDASGSVDFNDLVAALFLFGPCD